MTSKSHSASVSPRPRTNGTVAFDVRYRVDGRSRSTSFETAPAAEKWAALVRKIGPEAALNYLNLDTQPGSPTIAEYGERYIAGKSGVEPKTLQHYRMFMERHIGPTLGHLPLDTVTPEHIAAWINESAATGAAAKTIANWHGLFSGMFEQAVENELLNRNPCRRSRLPRTESTEMVFLSPDEFVRLLGYIPPRYQPIVLFLASTGCRWGEATAIRPGDIDVENRTVRIVRAWKSSQTTGYYIGVPKTRKSKRTIELPPEIMPHLEALIAEGREYVFTNKFGRPIRQANFHTNVWTPARNLANGLPAFVESKRGNEWHARAKHTWAVRKPSRKPLGKMPRIHDLRHSHVSWLLTDGVGIDVIQRRLGHESVQTTIDRYGHIAVERRRAAGDGIGRILSGAMPILEG